MTARIFDAHCDTVMKVVDEGADLLGPCEGHISAPDLLAAGVGCQVFACFASLMEHGDGVAQRSRALLSAAAALDGQGPFVMPRSADQLAALADQPDRVGLLLAVEGGEALGGRVEAVAELAGLGVRYLTMAWGDNDLTGSAFGGGKGLTGLGREVMAELERRRVLLDVSHMSDEAFADVAAAATRPFIASHSNCRAICDVPRNLSDDQLRAVARSGGVVGVNFVSGFLTAEAAAAQRPILKRYLAGVKDDPGSLSRRARQADVEIEGTPMPPLSAVADHVDHVRQVAGLDAVAFGSDFDGFTFGPEGLRGCRDFPAVLQLLRGRGWSEADLNRLCWGNWLRVFSQTFEGP